MASSRLRFVPRTPLIMGAVGSELALQSGSAIAQLVGGTNPNEPGGFSKIGERFYLTDPEPGWAPTSSPGRWGFYSPTDTIPLTTNGVQVANPGPNPISGGGFLAGKFTPSVAGGTGPWTSDMSPNFGTLGYRQVYRRIAFALSSNWVTGSKLMFLTTVDNVGATENKFYSTVLPDPGFDPKLQWNLQSGVPSIGGNGAAGNRNIQTSGTGAPVVRLTLNSWFDIEELLVMNTPGLADGILRTWVKSPAYNGGVRTQVVNVSNYAVIRAGFSPFWKNSHYNPTYNVNGTNPPDDIFHLVGYHYVSGAP